MGFLDYSRKTGSNVILREGFQELVQDTFSTIAEIMRRSIGPLGSYANILDGQYTSVSKDGFAIFKQIRFSNRYKSMIYNLIKAPCTKLNNTVGDGTTTAIVLTKHLFEVYMENKSIVDNYYLLPRDFIKAWDATIAEIIRKVTEYAVKPPNIPAIAYNIAYIASNGDVEISRNISGVYDESNAPVIKLKNSPTNKSYIEESKGFSFPANLIDDVYARNEDLSVELKNLKVLLFYTKVDSRSFEKIIGPINEVFRPHGFKLLILAPAYDELLANTVLKTYVNQEYRQHKDLNLILAQYQYKDLAPFQVEDLASLLGCKVLDYDTALQFSKKLEHMTPGAISDLLISEEEDEDIPFDDRLLVGNIPEADLSVHNGSIFSGFDTTDNEGYQRQLHQAEQALKDIMSNTDADKRNYAMEIGKANARIAQLKMENYVYYIGGDSSLQVSATYDAVDDVVKAVRSAVNHGIVPGCQISIIRACYSINPSLNNTSLREIIIQMIEKAVERLYIDVLSGPNGNGLIRVFKLKPEDTLALRQVERKVIDDSIVKDKVFDLERYEYNPNIITSVETDINVLLAASELVKLLISGNQCLFLDTVLNSAEEIDM